MDRRVIARTAAFNAVRLGSGFAFVGVLPFLVRRLTDDQYNLWTIVAQLPSYVNLLGAGVSVAVVRMVAAADGDADGLGSIVSSGIRSTARLAVVGVVAVGLLCVAFGLIFPGVPSHLMFEARVGTLLVGVGASVALLSIPLVSFFNGIQRNGASSITVVGSRVGGAIMVVIAIPWGLTAMFAALALALVVGAAGQVVLYGSERGGVRPIDRGRRTDIERDIASYTGTVAIWSIVNLMANGLDVALVGALDFEKVGAYGAALAIVTILAGVHTAAMSAFLPDVAKSIADGGRDGALVSASEVSGLLAWMSVAGVVALGEPVLRLGFGDDLAETAFPVLVVLTCGRAVGALIWPYVMGVLAANEQSRIRVTPVIEGVVNLTVSIVLVSWVGAVGAAIGTLVASVLAMSMHLWINVPRTPIVRFDRRLWFVRGVVMPVWAVLPLFVAALVRSVDDGPLGWTLVAVLGAASAVLAVVRLVSIGRRPVSQTP